MNEPKYFVVNNGGTQIPIQVLLPPKPPLRWAREYPIYCRAQTNRAMNAYCNLAFLTDYYYCTNFIAWANLLFPVY